MGTVDELMMQRRIEAMEVIDIVFTWPQANKLLQVLGYKNEAWDKNGIRYLVSGDNAMFVVPLPGKEGDWTIPLFTFCESLIAGMREPCYCYGYHDCEKRTAEILRKIVFPNGVEEK